MNNPITIIIGANGGIASALIKNLLSKEDATVVAISRSKQISGMENNNERLHWFISDNTEESISATSQKISELHGTIERIIITNGILHDNFVKPEKRLEDIKGDQLRHYYEINTITPMLWLRHCLLTLTFKKPSSIAVLSARIGSIEDNQIGGWYGYRSSKAALNMLLKTLAIEWQRREPDILFYSFHPGTTDTALSKPFQANVPKDKLFSPDFVADRLLSIMAESDSETNIRFVDWDGKSIQW